MVIAVLMGLLRAVRTGKGPWAWIPALSTVLGLPVAADGLPETIARVKSGVVGLGTVHRTRRPPSASKEFLAVLTGECNGTA